MMITKEQKELLTLIEKNKDNLTELFKIANRKTGSQLKIGESIEIAGISWSKFAEDEKGNAYMLADDIVCNSDFGEDNNWKNSVIRKEILQDLYIKMVQEIGAENMVLFKTDLFSHDGLRDYGEIEGRISLLTYDLYRNNRTNIKLVDKCFWLATPDSTPFCCSAWFVQYVDSDGSVGYNWCGNSCGVRPVFILKS